MEDISISTIDNLDLYFKNLNHTAKHEKIDDKNITIKVEDNMNFFIFSKAIYTPELRKNGNVILCGMSDETLKEIIEIINDIVIEDEFIVLSFSEREERVGLQYSYINQVMKLMMILENNDLFPICLCIDFSNFNNYYNVSVLIDDNNKEKISKLMSTITL